MTPLFPPIGCSYSRYMYPHKILGDAWLEAGPNLLAEKHNWLQLMLVQRPNIRPWYCAVGNFEFPTDLLCKKSTECCPRNFLQIFPGLCDRHNGHDGVLLDVGPWADCPVPKLIRVDPSWCWADHRGCSSVHHNQVAERPESQLSRHAVPCHAVPETSWSTQSSSTATNSLFNIFQTNWRNATKICFSQWMTLNILFVIPNVCCCLSLTD